MEDNNKKCVDFNINLAEISASQEDKALSLIDSVSSVNIACAVRSQSPLAMKRAVENCKFKSKVLGALVSLPEDIENPAELSEEEIEAIILYQLGAISSFAKACSLNIEYVRPEGKMYELMNSNKSFALSVAKAVKEFNKWFILYGAGDILKEVAKETDINIASEFIVDSMDAVEQLKSLIESGKTPDTLHFDAQSQNASELIEKTKEIVEPRPVNFNNVVASGWVE